MTRLSVLSSLLAAPLSVLGSANASATAIGKDNTVVFTYGIYSVAPGGGVRIVGATEIKVEGRTIEPGGARP